MAGACRALGTLIAAGVGESGPETTATVASTGEQTAIAAVASFAPQPGSAPPAALVGPPVADGGADSPPVAEWLGGGDAATKGIGLAILSGGMILLALTAFGVYGLVGGRDAPQRWRSVLDIARAPGGRSEALPILVLLVVSLAVWSAIALWVLLR